MYYLANLRNKVVINQFLLDTLFKAKRKNKRISYTNSKFYIGYDVFRILTSYQIWTHVLIVLCVWTRMSYPIGYKAVESSSVYKHIYFRWDNANYKKKKVNYFNVLDKQDASKTFYVMLNLHSFCVTMIFFKSNQQ